MSDFLGQKEVLAAIVGAFVGGIIGILGSVISFLIREYIRNKGRLIVLSNESSIIFRIRDNAGGLDVTTDINKAESIEFSINVDVYNQSDIPKTISGFEIELCSSENKKKFPVKRYKRTSSGIPYSITVPTLTIFPKQPAKIECTSYFTQQDFLPFSSRIQFYLFASFPDRKKFKTKILELDKTLNFNKD